MPDVRNAAACSEFCQEQGLVSIAHPISDEYGGWLNPGEAFYQLTVDSLKNDLMIAEACGSLGIVVHFGHLKSQDILEGYQNIIRMNDVLSSWTEGLSR